MKNCQILTGKELLELKEDTRDKGKNVIPAQRNRKHKKDQHKIL